MNKWSRYSVYSLFIWAITIPTILAGVYLSDKYSWNTDRIVWVIVVLVLLGMLALIVGFSLSLYAVIAKKITSKDRVVFFLSCAAVVVMIIRFIFFVPAIT